MPQPALALAQAAAAAALISTLQNHPLRVSRSKCSLNTKPCVLTLRRKQHALTADLAGAPLGRKLRLLLPLLFRKSRFLPCLCGGRLRRDLRHLRAAK
jgi:hypothetical protein